MIMDVVQATFDAAQITAIQTALNSAITNTISMFVSLVPVFATICGVAFGIRFVKGMFGKVGGTKVR